MGRDDDTAADCAERDLARHFAAKRVCEASGHAPLMHRYDWVNRRPHETAFFCPRCGAVSGDKPTGPTEAGGW